jgi:hypothetical protein
VTGWRDSGAYLKKRAISRLYPLSAAIPLGFYEQPELWVSEALKVCYVVNPKVASSSILVALTELATGKAVGEFWHNHPAVARFRRSSHRDVPADYFRFSVVRHPVDRLVSLYRQKFIRRRLEQSPFEYECYLGGLIALTDDFDTVCAKIAKIPDRIADRHFISQSFWFEKICRVPLDHVGRYETLAEDWAAICHRIGRFVELPVVNASASVPFEAAIPGSLQQRYAVDFERFGYRF